jgi:hypothetical protein
MRKSLLMVGAVSFVLMVTGVTLWLHLAQAHGPDHHDSAHCSLCQQLLISPKKGTCEPAAPATDEHDVDLSVDNCPEHHVDQFSPQPRSARAPPTSA